MDKKDLEQLINILKNQLEINNRTLAILEYMTPGSTSPQLKKLKDLITSNQSSLSEFEKNIKPSEE